MIFMQSTLEVRPEEAAAFNEVMSEIVAYQQKEQGWKLASAFVQFTGTLSTYIDVWELKDANHYQNGLFALRSHPEIARFRSVLSRAIIRETVVLAAPASYHQNRA